jgi:hypothetical protein
MSFGLVGRYHVESIIDNTPNLWSVKIRRCSSMKTYALQVTTSLDDGMSIWR